MEVFEEIYRQNETAVRRFLLRLTGCDAHLAEELTQETFYQAFLSFGSFRGNCQMRTWLCQIAKHVYARHIRNETKQRHIAETEQAAPLRTLPEQLEQKELLCAVRQIIAEMDETARTVTEYRLFSEMHYAEIAKLMQIRESTAMVIFSRAKAKIRRRLKEDYGYEI
ncbi:MAG: RNA polymerase sigma factor [Oscillospiraceae bacterium]|nr:RNA polymerase sigma factor [Oscillospiraceae bacterium]